MADVRVPKLCTSCNLVDFMPSKCPDCGRDVTFAWRSVDRFSKYVKQNQPMHLNIRNDYLAAIFTNAFHGMK